MKNLNINTNAQNLNGYRIVNVNLSGSMTEHDALELKKMIPSIFQLGTHEYVFSLDYVDELDMIGINALVKFKMVAMKSYANFRVRVPYKAEVVKYFETTKLDKALNVEFIQTPVHVTKKGKKTAVAA